MAFVENQPILLCQESVDSCSVGREPKCDLATVSVPDSIKICGPSSNSKDSTNQLVRAREAQKTASSGAGGMGSTALLACQACADIFNASKMTDNTADSCKDAEKENEANECHDVGGWGKIAGIGSDTDQMAAPAEETADTNDPEFFAGNCNEHDICNNVNEQEAGESLKAAGKMPDCDSTPTEAQEHEDEAASTDSAGGDLFKPTMALAFTIFLLVALI